MHFELAPDGSVSLRDSWFHSAVWKTKQKSGAPTRYVLLGRYVSHMCGYKTTAKAKDKVELTLIADA